MREVKGNSAVTSSLRSGTREVIQQRTSDLLEQVCGIPRASIHDGASVEDELLVESARFMELIVSLEEEFDVSIDFLEVLRRKTLAPIVDYIYAMTTAR